MSLTGSLGAFCLAEVSEAIAYEAFRPLLGTAEQGSLRAVQHSAEYLPLAGRGPDVR